MSKEAEFEHKLYSLLDKITSHSFLGVKLDVKPQYDVGNKKADLVVLDNRGIPVLVIETKRKGDVRNSLSSKTDPYSKTVVGQALCYSVMIASKLKMPETPMFATANPDRFLVFKPIDMEKAKDIVDLNECERGNYEKAIREGKYGDLKEDYKRHADFRDCGLLDLPLDDKDAFYNWYHSNQWAGCHPFEIVAGGLISNGILLWPPDEDGKYTLSAGSYIHSYVKAVKGLLEAKVPFKAPDLYEALKILTGEEYVEVNDYNSGLLELVYVSYYDIKKKNKVEWEQLEGVFLKKKKKS
ncbi:MAG: hypothetical protein JZD40_05195 [Sulfolobus sp.]|nr:hypothetical protein [Sulfolobus sp.]